jgi:hypothetical protein
LRGKGYEKRQIIMLKQTGIFLSIPLRGKGYEKRHSRIFDRPQNVGARVFIPLRGKGYEKHFISDIDRVDENLKKFPSPCGEKVMKNSRFPRAHSSVDYTGRFHPLAGKRL